jgi:DNA-binding NtrC family response regulator
MLPSVPSRQRAREGSAHPEDAGCNHPSAWTPQIMTSPPPLYQHVLVVEDDPIIALGLEDTINYLGVADIRIAANVATALAMIAERAPEFALLDVGLVREQSFAIAERLTTLGIPFAFSTGYGADRVPAVFSDRPRLPKPCPTDALEEVLRRRD